ncbi:MAG: transposase-like protein [Oleiphilaceae bacterium]|jgi:transposase-like protein
MTTKNIAKKWKNEAVRLVLDESRRVDEVAKKFGISQPTLYGAIEKEKHARALREAQLQISDLKQQLQVLSEDKYIFKKILLLNL